MRVLNKICPACQTTFEAKRKNKLYCTDDCRAATNNDKLKAKYHHIATLEKEKEMADKYKARFLRATRIMVIDYDENAKNDVITFENKKFRKEPISSHYVKKIGFTLSLECISEKNSRLAVYIPHEKALCVLPRYSSFSTNEEVTYRLIKKKRE